MKDREPSPIGGDPSFGRYGRCPRCGWPFPTGQRRCYFCSPSRGQPGALPRLGRDIRQDRALKDAGRVPDGTIAPREADALVRVVRILRELPRYEMVRVLGMAAERLGAPRQEPASARNRTAQNGAKARKVPEIPELGGGPKPGDPSPEDIAAGIALIRAANRYPRGRRR